jgi:hypothetical protein
MRLLKVTAPDKTVSLVGIGLKSTYERINSRRALDMKFKFEEVDDDEVKVSEKKSKKSH